MLTKLLKYDLKSQGRILGMMGLIELVVAVLNVLVLGLSRQFEGEVLALTISSNLLKIALVISSIATITVAVISSMLYYRKNILKDEGYLMNTLPVTPMQLVLSKLFSAMICWIGAFAVAIAGFSFGTLDIKWLTDTINEMKNSGLELGAFAMVILVVLIVFSFANSVMQFYTCLTMGYTIKLNSKANRDLLSILFYVVYYVIQNIISVISLVIFGVLNYKNIDSAMDALNGMDNVTAITDYFTGVISIALVVDIIWLAVFFVICNNRLKKHICLE